MCSHRRRRRDKTVSSRRRRRRRCVLGITQLNALLVDSLDCCLMMGLQCISDSKKYRYRYSVNALKYRKTYRRCCLLLRQDLIFTDQSRRAPLGHRPHPAHTGCARRPDHWHWDGWLSWPCWLTDSGRTLYPQSGHTTAVSLAQDRESSPTRTSEPLYATPPTNVMKI